MKLRVLYKASIGLVIAVFLIIGINDIVKNNSKSDYIVLLVGNETSSSENYKWIKNHPKVWSVGTGRISELESYNLPHILPTYLVKKVKVKLFSRETYVELIFSTTDIEELKKFLNK